MAHLESAIDRRSLDFQANTQAMREKLAVLREKLSAAAQGGSPNRVSAIRRAASLWPASASTFSLTQGHPF